MFDLKGLVFTIIVVLAITWSVASSAAAKSQKTHPQKSNISSPQTHPNHSISPITMTQRSLASVVALGPGAIFSGGGHWLINDDQSAHRLFWWKLGGWVGMLSGGFILAQSGASHLVTPWVIPLLIGSGAATITPTVLDLVGVWADKESTFRLPSLHQSPLLKGQAQSLLTISTGTRRTTLHPYHSFYALDWRQQFKKTAYQLNSAWSQSQYRVKANIERLMTRGKGWALWTRLGFITHQQLRYQVALYQGEGLFRVAMRFQDLIGPHLSSMSGEVFAGWSGGGLSYRVGPLDQVTGILGGFALTHHSFQDHLRIHTRYNHRHDDWVGGAVVPGLGSGILGFLSLSTSLKVHHNLWISTQASFGSAHLYTLDFSWALHPIKRS